MINFRALAHGLLGLWLLFTFQEALVRAMELNIEKLGSLATQAEQFGHIDQASIDRAPDIGESSLQGMRRNSATSRASTSEHGSDGNIAPWFRQLVLDPPPSRGLTPEPESLIRLPSPGGRSQGARSMASSSQGFPDMQTEHKIFRGPQEARAWLSYSLASQNKNLVRLARISNALQDGQVRNAFKLFHDAAASLWKIYWRLVGDIALHDVSGLYRSMLEDIERLSATYWGLTESARHLSNGALETGSQRIDLSMYKSASTSVKELIETFLECRTLLFEAFSEVSIPIEGNRGLKLGDILDSPFNIEGFHDARVAGSSLYSSDLWRHSSVRGT